MKTARCYLVWPENKKYLWNGSDRRIYNEGVLVTVGVEVIAEVFLDTNVYQFIEWW